MTRINLDKAPELLHTAPGLIIGPDFAFYPSVTSDWAETVALQLKLDARGSLLKTWDEAIDRGFTAPDLRAALAKVIVEAKPAPQLGTLAKVKWKAVLSFCLDDAFERRLQQEGETRRPGRPLLTVLHDLTQPPLPRTYPLYKLLGNLDRSDAAVSTSTYLRRIRSWHHALKSFIDRVKTSPVLCLGMGSDAAMLFELLAGMTEPSLAPASMVFLVEDPIAENRRVSELLYPRTRHIVLNATAGEFVREIERAESTAFTSSLPFGAKAASNKSLKLEQFSDFICLVNDQIKPSVSKDQVNLLHDLLFSPSRPRWDSFAHGLDFRRTITQVLRVSVDRALKEPFSDHSAVILTGTAASGKTMFLKRLAYDLANAGEATFWLTPWSFSDAQSVFLEIFETISHSKGFSGKRLVVFMDDPVGFGTAAARDVAAAARTRAIEIVFVIGARTTDWLTAADREGLIGSLAITDEVEMPVSLDNEEFASLPEYLKLLGIVGTDEEAAEQVRGARSGNSPDTLSMLYFLLPATRATIASAVRQEFSRLGDMAGLSKVLIGTVERTSELLKSGYEMVAIADYYRAPLPIEVLVSALRVDYRPWLDAAGPDGAAWGILYAETSREGDTTCYRPRNSIVTRLIVDTINGHGTHRAGEAALLSQLLSGCNGSQPVYQRFCTQILVSNDRLDKLDYEDGLRLYDDALGALPKRDKTLLHHKGLWIKNKGHDPIAAGRVLEEALSTPNSPQASRPERNELIHTSLAAAAVQSVIQRKLDFNRGAAAALDHLNKARSTGYFSAHATHVQANLMAELADQLGSTPTADTFNLINRAVSDVDRGILLVKNDLQRRSPFRDDAAMLEAVREKVLLRLGALEDLRADAARMWTEQQRQDGFVLVARKLFQQAVEIDKGKNYKVAMDYCHEAMAAVRASAVHPIPGLFEVALHIYYKWEVTRARPSFYDHIDWSLVHDFSAAVLNAADKRTDVFYKYLHALALSHQGKWPDASLLFHQARQLGLSHDFLFAPRDLLLEPKGGYRRVQGVIKQGVDRLLLYVEELHWDFSFRRGGKARKDGEIVQGYIQFSFGGMTAIENI